MHILQILIQSRWIDVIIEWIVCDKPYDVDYVRILLRRSDTYVTQSKSDKYVTQNSADKSVTQNSTNKYVTQNISVKCVTQIAQIKV